MLKIIWGRSLNYNIEYNQARDAMKITKILSCTEWTPSLIIWPRKTISGRWAFFERLHQRRVWVTWGNCLFHIEPENQYADVLEMLNDPFQDLIDQMTESDNDDIDS